MPPSIDFETYVRFQERLPLPVLEPVEDFGWEDLSELEWQSRWFEGDFGTQFKTTEGKEVEILDFGIWNHSAGPDFIHCAGKIDGAEFRGDIELDTCLQDWEKHGHRDNVYFEQVRLHLHLWNAQPSRDFFVRTSDHRLVPQIRLNPQAMMGKTQSLGGFEVRLGKCAELLKEMSETAIQSLLSSAANHRLQLKENLWLRRVQIHGRDQAAFQALAGALGYSRNSQSFTILSQRLSLREIGKLRSTQFEALFFGVAGFLEKTHFDTAPKDTQVYLKKLWTEWWQLRHEYLKWLEVEHQVNWDFTGTRPMNHPQRRLAALVVLLQKWRQTQKRLFPKDETELSYENVLQYLERLEHEYWQHHYTLNSAYQSKAMSLIGQVRAHEIYVNVILPMFWKSRPALWEHYQSLAAPDLNQQVRRAALRLFGDGRKNFKWLKKAIYQQGLLQIYRDFCMKDYSACDQCVMPQLLSLKIGNDKEKS